MLKKITEKKQYKKAHDMINVRKFPVLIHLADVLNRYIDIRFKNQIDWLKINALMIIAIKGGIVNLSQLSGSMIRPRWTITKLVDDMETDGWVKRVNSPKDRRSTLIKATQSGLEAMGKFLLFCDQAEKEILDTLEKEDVDDLVIISRLLISRFVEVTSSHHNSFLYFHRGMFYKELGRRSVALANFKRSLETAREKSLIKRLKQEIKELEVPT
jgi:DNA-binding MarR family transcriptional regulator